MEWSPLLLEKKMTPSWMASSRASHWKCHLFIFFCLYRLVFFKQSFACGFMIQSTWWYYKFLTSLRPLVPSLHHAASALPAEQLQVGSKNCVREEILPFLLLGLGFFSSSFFFIFFKPERSLLWLVECPVSGLG